MTSDRPVIGLTGYATAAAWGVWDTDALLLPWAYVEAVAAAGGLPVVLPPQPGVVDGVLDRLDGLILSGGPDVEPSRYGQEPGPDTQPPRPERDSAELALLARAVDADLPLLGVCRGLQVLNVARGGTLHQHLPDVLGHGDHAVAPGRYNAHAVSVAPGSRLAGLLGRTEVDSVPSYHHQGLDALGAGLVASAWSPDGIVEAVEDPSRTFCVAVQWHPEEGADLSLFRGLVAAAAGGRAARTAAG